MTHHPVMLQPVQPSFCISSAVHVCVHAPRRWVMLADFTSLINIFVAGPCRSLFTPQLICPVKANITDQLFGTGWTTGNRIHVPGYSCGNQFSWVLRSHSFYFQHSYLYLLLLSATVRSLLTLCYCSCFLLV